MSMQSDRPTCDRSILLHGIDYGWSLDTLLKQHNPIPFEAVRAMLGMDDRDLRGLIEDFLRKNRNPFTLAGIEVLASNHINLHMRRFAGYYRRVLIPQYQRKHDVVIRPLPDTVKTWAQLKAFRGTVPLQQLRRIKPLQDRIAVLIHKGNRMPSRSESYHQLGIWFHLASSQHLAELPAMLSKCAAWCDA